MKHARIGPFNDSFFILAVGLWFCISGGTPAPAQEVDGEVDGFVISDRNMYVRRFTPTGEVNRYRNKIYLSRPMAVVRYKFNPFFFDEVYHDFVSGPWLPELGGHSSGSARRSGYNLSAFLHSPGRSGSATGEPSWERRSSSKWTRSSRTRVRIPLTHCE